ncbi:glycosyltransferase family 4 protein [Marinithermus hydrothermalis]|uniref:Glycosyl transferase group 1 n=1 Tax=Marinithermus hydrothermalis (strain DSM 14884 / JCM 11576 / T1) TaxID=869210 RepID=F2NL81_MARHT|nr:glycosyltransferase family 4 protein [Marinithermus hydrothermalis]AEB11484.1 glycosyl transferase group 1 [Marinithermus hydrothermalis DSM 14884]
MRIAHVTATFPPYWAGTGNVAYHNARVLAERGHEVTVFTAQTSPNGALAAPFSVERLAVAFRLGNAPLTPSLLTRLEGFDLIHLHYPYIFGAEMTAWRAARGRVPLVVTYHNRLEDPSPFKRLAFGVYNRTIEGFVLRAAARVLAVSLDHLFHVHPRLRGASHLRELPNGVDTHLFRPVDPTQARAALGLSPEDRVVLFVGALDAAHRFKNFEGLLEAFARLALERKVLLVVGDGPLRRVYEDQARRLGVASRVRFLGPRAPQDLPPIYSAADVTVLPSIGVESFGLVLLESLACGTPVIASALPGVRTVVAHGSDGYLVPPGDVPALARALEELLADRARAVEMGCRGRARVEQRYAWPAIGARLEAVYREVLG